MGLPWFDLRNPDIDWRTREIHYRQPREATHKVSTISLRQLREERAKESMFVIEVSVRPSNSTKEESIAQLPEKYRHYASVFDKYKSVLFLTIDCMIVPMI